VVTRSIKKTKKRTAPSPEEPWLEQWFLVARGADEKAKDAVSKATKATDEVIEIIGNICQQPRQLGYNGRGGPTNSSGRAYKADKHASAPRLMSHMHSAIETAEK
jgi:hypothetical protein